MNGLGESCHQSPSDPEESSPEESDPEESDQEESGLEGSSLEESDPEERGPEESMKRWIPSPRVSNVQVQVPGDQILFEGDGLGFSE